MSKIPKSEWTALEREFYRLVVLAWGDLTGECSADIRQQKRREGRKGLGEVLQEHGKEAMDAMWERIK